jgi:hypothetical protein
MTRLRILIKMESADAFELKAQALNKDPRLKEAGIAALKFTGDKQYIADGEFSPELPPLVAPATASPKNKSTATIGKRLRVVLRIPNEDSYELKAQALNNDPNLKQVGIAALKFVDDKNYISDGEFSSEPPSSPSAAEPKKSKWGTVDERLRVVLRIPAEDAYELKAQALNNDPRLSNAGISALKYTGDKNYISKGEFSPELPSLKSERVSSIDEKVRVTLRIPRKDAYELVAKQLNNDPALIEAGISGVELAKGTGMVPIAKKRPSRPRKKKRSFARLAIAAIIVGLIGVTGAGALYFSNPPAAPIPTKTSVALIPVSGEEPTDIATPVPPTETLAPPTDTKIPTSTKTQRPTATNTQLPTATVVSCIPPSEAVVTAANLSCRYGPGADYLYRAGLAQGNVVDVLGKADTAYNTWIRVQTRWEEPAKCWVNSSPRFVEIPQGDVACLEPLYPDKAPLILFNTDLFPKPYNVTASRSEDLVYIDWVGYDLLPGDRPEASPAYLTETWTCQDGELVFSPQGWDEPSGWVRDEGGCDEASYGYVYMAHVDGYIGPATIPWPP